MRSSGEARQANAVGERSRTEQDDMLRSSRKPRRAERARAEFRYAYQATSRRRTDRIVIAVDEESLEVCTGRAARAGADLPGQQPTLFPPHHGGDVGGEPGYT